MDEHIEQLNEALDTLDDQVQRHRRLLEAIQNEPDAYADDTIETYFEALSKLTDETDLIAPLEESFEQLEQGADAQEEKFLANIDVIVDDQTIEGTEVEDFEPDAEPPRAVLFIPSPKVNQMRGTRQQLVDEEGHTYEFSIEKTLVADMHEDKTGMLKLVLELEPSE